ncbi:hypothetical protein HEP85_02015 [Streptomyces sp. RPA4-2]|uniref:hypothetical protein n=1 Tax=Streptomyces sp. RPA4-2 TaxID=2721244 RepID=UPI00143E38DB|nr:hypothetical protein [Streptomyces sp. RPA4-2]QIY60689.1 hypothetical protein HEP85_02015 [Streptomyces sp. RPA4-2]
MARDSFPPDLVELHLAYTRTYRALAGASPGQGARLRRDVVRLHPSSSTGDLRAGVELSVTRPQRTADGLRV